jgi:hypothetical protein
MHTNARADIAAAAQRKYGKPNDITDVSIPFSIVFVRFEGGFGTYLDEAVATTYAALPSRQHRTASRGTACTIGRAVIQSMNMTRHSGIRSIKSSTESKADRRGSRKTTSMLKATP